MKHKLPALVIIALGILSTMIDAPDYGHDSTACVFTLMIGVPMLFMKEDRMQ